jgi:hypothetical protein
MNERIKELAEQAQQYAEYCTPQGLEWFPMFKEKFAELLILECVETLGTHEDYWTHEQSMAELKKHFGVEE